ncbi:DUF202 domain-containing protein [Pseudomonas putida]|nr:DUF202 domain-containing protein [Pseudomonas sp. HD6421]MBF8746780.1 DUF202 domain-containing protein [Pseudomonas monteilii]TDJ75760.1 DUF202 domain-containing protein [Pseudomonas putida]
MRCSSVLSPADEGLQPERTLLAWRRTILAMVVCSCFFLRWVPHHHWSAVLPAVACMITALLAWLGLKKRYQLAASGLSAQALPASVCTNLLLALCVTGLCALELAAILMA